MTPKDPDFLSPIQSYDLWMEVRRSILLNREGWGILKDVYPIKSKWDDFVYSYHDCIYMQKNKIKINRIHVNKYTIFNWDPVGRC